MNGKQILSFFVSLALGSLLVTGVLAAAPDGVGPWADAVVTSSQGNTKGGTPVSIVNPARSNPESAVGPAEESLADGTFFSLGFGGSITLRFDNPISNGVVVVESTYPDYPVEQARVELSADGTTWVDAGTVAQDGEVIMPESLTCARYARVTDISNPDDFSEDTADAYDVDGVRAAEGEPCDTVTPTPTPTVTPTPGPSNGGNSNNGGDGSPAVCTASKPSTPTLNSVNRTSATTAELSWSAATPVTHYAISYGVKPGEYIYGVANTGNVTSFTVGGLDPNATYYFIVRGVNDCTPGDPSGEKSTGNVLGASTGGQVLGASTDTLAATGSNTLGRLLGAILIAAGVYFIGMTRVKSNETI